MINNNKFGTADSTFPNSV